MSPLIVSPPEKIKIDIPFKITFVNLINKVAQKRKINELREEILGTSLREVSSFAPLGKLPEPAFGFPFYLI